jgi:hypothetical protein
MAQLLVRQLDLAVKEALRRRPSAMVGAWKRKCA